MRLVNLIQLDVEVETIFNVLLCAFYSVCWILRYDRSSSFSRRILMFYCSVCVFRRYGGSSLSCFLTLDNTFFFFFLPAIARAREEYVRKPTAITSSPTERQASSYECHAVLL
ncbi:unnamed protein product [Ectocarpus sp. 8 AP-2014]